MRRKHGSQDFALLSSANADDPVAREVEVNSQCGAYWIPAFAGMTSYFREDSMPNKYRGEIGAELGGDSARWC